MDGMTTDAPTVGSRFLRRLLSLLVILGVGDVLGSRADAAPPLGTLRSTAQRSMLIQPKVAKPQEFFDFRGIALLASMSKWYMAVVVMMLA